MTVCGLSTVDLSSLTAWQQVILFIQMCLGSPVRVVVFLFMSRMLSILSAGGCFMGHGLSTEVGLVSPFISKQTKRPRPQILLRKEI